MSSRVQSGGVLLCVHGEVAEIPLVASALRERWGIEPLLFDPAKFPTGAPLALEYSRAGTFGRRWASVSAPVPAEISAVWQAVHVGADLPRMEPGVRETCVAASETAVVGLLDSLSVFQLDPYWNVKRAENKPYQLRVAQRVGLEIPETIITNDPAAVRAFAQRCESLITKVLVQPAIVGPVAEDGAPVVFTNTLGAAELEDLDGLELCPMIFQERIPNRLDLRVTIVGTQIFAASVDDAGRGGDDLDWRRQGYMLDRAPVWSPYDALPDDIDERLFRLMDHLGLNCGAADFIVTPEGRCVFLELNPTGSFAFLGAPLAPQIAAAIADVLADPAARRVPNHGDL